MWCERVSSLRESLLHNTDKSHRYNADRSVIGLVAVFARVKIKSPLPNRLPAAL